ncbi:uncharacterized protein LOC123513987 isoform X2 [Portunus trituberculatus]|nr:uncharacterized protein LOC123513987 isoform X2 [Portunus trituberculatus]
MLSGSEEEQSTRRPFEFLTNIFKRRREHDCETETEDEASRPPDITLHGPNDSGPGWAGDDMVSPPRRTPAAGCLEASVTSLEEGGGATAGPVHHTPVKSRDIGIDMEAIRLSRQDNPYLQRVAESQTTLTEEEEAAEDVGGSQQEDRAHLVTQASQEGVLSLSEVHEHLIRSPPPTTLPRTLPKSVFVFPASKGGDGTNAQSETSAAPATGPGRPSQVLKPVVARQHEDVLDNHLRQILHTQRQLAVARGRPGESGGVGCSSVPASPAHSRALTRRSPHARTHSEEASVVQNAGGSSEASPVMGLGVGGSGGMSVSAPGMGTLGTGSLSGLAPVMPPGRRQHSSNDLLLNPANPPISNSPTPSPPVLKPISSKTKKGLATATHHPIPGLAPGGHIPMRARHLYVSGRLVLLDPACRWLRSGVCPEGASSSAALRLPIRYPHQPATSSTLIDIT